MHHQCEVQFLMWAWENFTLSLELFPGDLQRSVPQNGRVHLLVLEESPTDWPYLERHSAFCDLRLVTLPALQKTFVNFSFVFA